FFVGHVARPPIRRSLARQLHPFRSFSLRSSSALTSANVCASALVHRQRRRAIDKGLGRIVNGASGSLMMLRVLTLPSNSSSSVGRFITSPNAARVLRDPLRPALPSTCLLGQRQEVGR